MEVETPEYLPSRDEAAVDACAASMATCVATLATWVAVEMVAARPGEETRSFCTLESW